ncbi:TrkA C-terminal domain-containing protein [Sulfuricurvum sp.]|uniref:COG3400 family protein n=1 Tax=Sulfuricurvum sp. TaxID=2025608 RepID=UPI00261D16C0|nr:TrkA C-terminal domain-containing protein [Sulfuricurvum sp.]MDD2780640.1 TrkA C-terminal domain-containing protein [Sulfuricurvum sp.]
MKKILIISDGAIGNHYIERVIGTYTSENLYYVVHTQHKSFEGYNPARFKFFQFDPTSFYKISNLLKMDFWQVLLVMENQTDLEHTIKNIRLYKPSIRIIALDLWNALSPTDDIEWVNMQELIAANLIDYLPNIPVLAKNIGLGSGEIMEVLVPFGSSFVYRHIGSIEQKNWKIAAIYRNRQLIIPSDNKMIQPNDTLVLVGDPAVLRSIYRAIKRELGQFPAPFGSKIYLYIDMDMEKASTIMALVRRSIYIQKKLRQPLIIKVINPGDIEALRMIKASAQSGVTIDISYGGKPDEEMILSDIKKYHIGLFVVSSTAFSLKSIRKKLYTGNVPVLKLAERSFASLKESVVVLSEEGHIENISTTIFDVSSQFGFNLELIDYANDEGLHKREVIEHFHNLSTIFSKSIHVSEQEENPIRELCKRSNFLHVLPFTTKMFVNPLNAYFSTDPEVLYRKLNHYHQLFIPTQI